MSTINQGIQGIEEEKENYARNPVEYHRSEQENFP
jgi:hypothetical protein